MAKHAIRTSSGSEISPNEIRRQCDIEVKNLSKRYGSKMVVNSISFHAKPGRVTGFLGVNGAGKSTTLRMITGLTSPSSGRALVAGAPYKKLSQPCRWVGAMLDASNVNPSHTGRAHLRIQASYAQVDDKRVMELLHVTGLSKAADQPILGYSLGMRQRLGLAAALLADPPILILDEPSNGLDPEGNRWLWELLREFASQGRTVLVSSHNLADIGQSVDDVVMLQSGRICYAGTLASLESLGGCTVNVKTVYADKLVGLADAQSWRYRLNADSSIDVFDVAASTVGQAMFDTSLPVYSLIESRTCLEDLFFTLAKSGTESSQHFYASNAITAGNNQ